MSLLTVERLSVVYQRSGERSCAVDGVSFAIESGEILALVGESGSGKSSVALALTKLPPVSTALVSGRVLFSGMDLLQSSEDTLRAIRGGRISYVFQDPATSLNPVLTIGEQLIETLLLHTDSRQEAAKRAAIDWLARVGIPSPRQRLGAYPHEFSGGMQQRVMLAMAVAAQPSILVADEPTTALDVTIQVQILRLLRDLQQTLKLSILLISHDLLVVERIAHRVGVMSQGRLVELGSVGQVLHEPTHPHTKALLRYRFLLSFHRKV